MRDPNPYRSDAASFELLPESERSGIRRREGRLDHYPDRRSEDHREEAAESAALVAETRERLTAMFRDEHPKRRRTSSVVVDSAPVVANEKTWWQSMREATMKNRWVKAALVAVGLHAPMVPQVRSYVEKYLPQQTAWEKPNMVLHPQGEESRKRVMAAMYERGERIDRKKLEAFRQEQAAKLERGESGTFADTYFQLEELNGVAPEKVKEAKAFAEKVVEEYSREIVHDEIPESLLQHIADDMVPDGKTYDWGQASVAEYFVKWKEMREKHIIVDSRNCVSSARAIHIVVDGLLHRLPEEARRTYELPKVLTKQHQEAAVLHHTSAGDEMFIFQRPFQKTAPEKIRAGVAVVPEASVRKAAVADKPVSVGVTAGEVKKSPDLDFVTDEPFKENYEVRGELAGSEAVREMAESQGVKPEEKRYVSDKGVMELEIERPTTVEEAREIARKVYGLLPARAKINGYVHGEGIIRPSPEAIDALAPTPRERARLNLVSVELNDLSTFSVEAARRVVHLPVDELSLRTTSRTEFLPSGTLIRALQEEMAKKREASFGFKVMTVQPAAPWNETEEGMVAVKGEGLKELVRSLKGVDLYLGYRALSYEALEALGDTQTPVYIFDLRALIPSPEFNDREIEVEKATIPDHVLDRLKKAAQPISIDAGWYLILLKKDPTILHSSLRPAESTFDPYSLKATVDYLKGNYSNDAHAQKIVNQLEGVITLRENI